MMKKIYLILLLAAGSAVSVFSQTALNEFVVTKDENPPRVFYKSEGCTPSDGVLVFYTTIPNLKFDMPDTPGRLKNVSAFDPENSQYVLCVQPTDKTIGGITKYNLSITANNFKPMPAYPVININAAEPQYFRIDPKESEQVRLERLKLKKAERQAALERQKREQAEQQAALERQKREVAERNTKIAGQGAVYERINRGNNKDDKKFSYGAFAGIAIANHVSNSWIYEDEDSLSIGLNIGMLFEFKLSKLISFQPELRYVRKGSKGNAYRSDMYFYTETGEYIPDVFVKSIVKINYLEVPFNFVFNIPIRDNKFFLGAGLSVSYGLSGKITHNPSKQGVSFNLSDEEKETDVFYGKEPIFNRFDYGMNFLAGYCHGIYFVKADYNRGLINISNDDETGGWGKFTNNCFNLSVGAFF